MIFNVAFQTHTVYATNLEQQPPQDNAKTLQHSKENTNQQLPMSKPKVGGEGNLPGKDYLPWPTRGEDREEKNESIRRQGQVIDYRWEKTNFNGMQKWCMNTWEDVSGGETLSVNGIVLV